MALFWTNFEDLVIGQRLGTVPLDDNWFTRATGINLDQLVWNVRTPNTGALGQRVIEMSKSATNSGVVGQVWNVVPPTQQLETIMRVRPNKLSTSGHYPILAGAQNANEISTIDYIGAGPYTASNSGAVRGRTRNASSVSTPGSATDVGWVSETGRWYWVRARYTKQEGTTWLLECKMWEHGTAEPSSWQFNATATWTGDNPVLPVLVFGDGVNSSGIYAYIDVFAAGTDGDSAPTNNPAPGLRIPTIITPEEGALLPRQVIPISWV